MRLRLSALLAAVLLVLAVAACGGSSSKSSSSSSSGSRAASSSSATSSAAASAAGSAGAATGGPSNGIGYEGVPLELGPYIASPSTTRPGTTVDGVHCAPVEQLAYHIHAHLAVFDDGRLWSLPAGIGIPGSVATQTDFGPVATGGQCFYWLHTHTTDGVIHIESPTQRIYTLGDFFDEWDQPLTASQVGDLHGKITAFFNGKPWTKSLRAIPLLPHALIQFNIGEPTPPLMTVNWTNTQL